MRPSFGDQLKAVLLSPYERELLYDAALFFEEFLREGIRGEVHPGGYIPDHCAALRMLAGRLRETTLA